jgi:hypothetical protein
VEGLINRLYKGRHFCGGLLLLTSCHHTYGRVAVEWGSQIKKDLVLWFETSNKLLYKLAITFADRQRRSLLLFSLGQRHWDSEPTGHGCQQVLPLPLFVKHA